MSNLSNFVELLWIRSRNDIAASTVCDGSWTPYSPLVSHIPPFIKSSDAAMTRYLFACRVENRTELKLLRSKTSICHNSPVGE